MSPHQILAVAIRVVVLWLFLNFMFVIGSSISNSLQKGSEVSISWAFVVLVLIVVCYLVWMFPLTIARKILPTESDAAPHPSNLNSWFSLGCVLIGVWLVCKATAALFAYLFTYLWVVRAITSLEIPSQWVFEISFNAIQLAFGVWLLLGSNSIKTWLDRARG